MIIDEELYNLKQWFNVEYSQKEQKLRRLISLNKLTDDGKDPNDELQKLFLLAEEKRRRIQELEDIK